MEQEIKIEAGENLETAVKKLLGAEAKGEHAYCVFNGVTLHSENISIDSAYMAVMGCSKEEFDKRRKEEMEKIEEELRLDKAATQEERKRFREERRLEIERFNEEQRLEKEAAKEKVPGWIERGERLIYPERFEEWTRRVVRCANGMYAGAEVETALEIMTALENGATIEEAKQICMERGESAFPARALVFSFSKRGPEFMKAVLDPSEEFKLPDIEAKERENQELARAHSVTNGSTGKHI